MRIFKHLRSDWFRYGFETLAVIVGILVAFALENWREERQSKDQTGIFLQHIESNIAEDLEELSTLMIHLDLTIKRAETLITSFKTASFDAYEASVNSGWLNVEILILIRLVHSEAEREIYHLLIDSSIELQASIKQILLD